ncbi:MAG: NAD(P)H:quinone oxidoreductase [Ramlibacter sp.]
MANITIVYYSSTGNTYGIARAIEAGAQAAGAQVRLRRVHELAGPEAIAAKPAWGEHLNATKDVPEATLADLEWADGYVFGSPTRFGLPAAQLKQFIDTLGPLWATGKLQDKAACAFTGAGNLHGGQESTLLALHNMFYHWGSVIVPPGYTDPSVKEAGGNPYGTSFTAGAPLGAQVLAAAHHQGRRVARFAGMLASARG